MVFVYNEDDFQCETSWEKPKETSFDVALKSKWQTAAEKGYFRYRLNILGGRRLPGKLSFFAQLNTDRAQNRRSPETIHSLTQPFSHNKFNFTKIHENEVLFEIRKKQNTEVEPIPSNKDFITINISPLEYGHSLFLPNRFSCLPQVLTLHSLKSIIEVVLLSGTPSLRAGFNSLCGFATVNHLHCHLYYLQQPMLLESVEVKRFSGPCHVLTEYPAPAFVFQLNPDHNVQDLASSVYKLTSYLQNTDVAHNVYITRGAYFRKSNPENSNSILDTIRVYVWSRKHSVVSKNVEAFDPAICELFGHIVVKVPSAYASLTESDVASVLASISQEPFAAVQEAVRKLFEEDKH